MRCSSCESALDRYLEGSLSARKMMEMRAHLQQCDICQALLLELRVVDGLLETMRRIEPAPNFTFAAMAEITSMPQPRIAPTRTLSFIGIYLAAVWALAGIWFIVSGTSARAVLGSITAVAARGLGTVTITAAALLHPLAHGSPLTTVFIGALLLDLALALAFFIVYSVLRPRLAARLAHVREVV